MAKSSKNEQGNGKKFQERQPGEKRNRKIDFGKTDPKKTKFFGDKKPNEFQPKPNENTRSNDRFDRRGNTDNRERPAKREVGYGKPRELNKTTNFPRGGSNNTSENKNTRDGGRTRFGKTDRFEVGNSRKGGVNPKNPRYLDKGGYTGGDKLGNPRFPGDRSARFDNPKGQGFSKDKSFDRGNKWSSERFERQPRTNTPSNDKPKFNQLNRENNRRFDRPDKGDSHRGEGGFKGYKSERSQDGFSRGKSDAVDPRKTERPQPKSPTGGLRGLAKFKPRTFDKENQKETPVEPQKTYGIPKADLADTPKAFKGSKREFHRVSNNLEKSATQSKSNEIRLNRYIANSGICSRREADDLILQGLVRVNGEIVTELGTKVKPHDNVKLEDRKVIPEKPVYIIMNKPKGYITTTDDPDGRKTVMELIDLPGKERIYPIGRLDRNTTGVLLLTNDGEMTQKLMHPSFEIKKVYRATLDRKPSKEHMLQLVEGVELEDGFMAFEQCGFVEEGKETVLGIEIKSGRNRIVRRMFEHFGYEVTALDRVLLGEFDKVKLGRGKWRFLTEKEMNYVDRLKRTKAKAPKA